MHILQNISLKPYNTFGIDAKAKHFVAIKSVEELKSALALEAYPNKFILGGGSNMLLTQDLDALVIKMNIKGIEVVSEDETHVIVKSGAGETWHEFVLWCLARNYGGIENLSLIPGYVGASPIQNIGAYGVEVKDVFQSCNALHIESLDSHVFEKDDCQFGYRESIFKSTNKGEYVITSVSFKLKKKNHILHTSYGAITTELDLMGIKNPTIQDVSKAVIAIRESKLPNPKDIGNSGSFFKNPVVSLPHFNRLRNNFPEIPHYPVSETEVKIPAGWLIEKSGFKGKTLGNYGVHKKQALVLVNYNDAKGEDIYNLALLIQKTIAILFEIPIEMEVNII